MSEYAPRHGSEWEYAKTERHNISQDRCSFCIMSGTLHASPRGLTPKVYAQQMCGIVAGLISGNGKMLARDMSVTGFVFGCEIYSKI